MYRMSRSLIFPFYKKIDNQIKHLTMVLKHDLAPGTEILTDQFSKVQTPGGCPGGRILRILIDWCIIHLLVY